MSDTAIPKVKRSLVYLAQVKKSADPKSSYKTLGTYELHIGALARCVEHKKETKTPNSMYRIKSVYAQYILDKLSTKETFKFKV